MKTLATLSAAFAATLMLGVSVLAAAPTAPHHGMSARLVKQAAKPLAATSGKRPVTAQASACCAGGNCCANGACCAMPGCCRPNGGCCAPAKGTCTSACGCLTMTCCH